MCHISWIHCPLLGLSPPTQARSLGSRLGVHQHWDAGLGWDAISPTLVIGRAPWMPIDMYRDIDSQVGAGLDQRDRHVRIGESVGCTAQFSRVHVFLWRDRTVHS
ncbi:hypothetical protein BCR44DRAFT_1278250 [Catenaria anguillulae PL171]|uniref:Uncharacterized protein n=1 Tax=Catenaria anguillulae PL171 TaxID=765915 RepID=A0A1Y2H9A0_9FUNG|nr:hypothetical protein BCR44DRAFT_1278250 [Catenaria anguillulae PL171]